MSTIIKDDTEVNVNRDRLKPAFSIRQINRPLFEHEAPTSTLSPSAQSSLPNTDQLGENQSLLYSNRECVTTQLRENSGDAR